MNKLHLEAASSGTPALCVAKGKASLEAEGGFPETCDQLLSRVLFHHGFVLLWR